MVYRCQTLCFKALSLESFWLCPSMSFYSFHLRDIDGIRMVSPATACASSVSTELSCCAKAKGDKAKSLWISGSALPWCWSPWTLSPSWSTTTRRTITTSWSSPPPQSSNHHQIIKSSNHQNIKSSNHQIIKSSTHQIIKTSNHQIINIIIVVVIIIINSIIIIIITSFVGQTYVT